MVVCDISFIPLAHILSCINVFAKEDIIILFKPQFEVGKEVKRNNYGVVQDDGAVERAIEEFLLECAKFSWKLTCQTSSKLAGKSGNVEYFFCFKRDG